MKRIDCNNITQKMTEDRIKEKIYEQTIDNTLSDKFSRVSVQKL